MSAKFLLIFMSLLTAPTVKNSYTLAWSLLYLSKKTSWSKLENLSISNLDLRSEKELSNNTKFSSFLQIN